MNLLQLLKQDAPEWDAYIHHAFVEDLGEGTLPLPVFQDYLVQDYLFLVQYARANALAAYKSRNLGEIQAAAQGLSATITETELHRRLTERWGITREELDHAPEKQATVAYTRYVLDTGMAGDLLELQIALAPCQIGYAEIGTYLEPKLKENPDHPYAEWIQEYAGEDFQNQAEAMTTLLDDLLSLPAHEIQGTKRYERLLDIFRTATRLEADFWQQALDA
ncbi:thiaminase II [Corynebacterium urinipleomorphum]|uniref:thiaminase II n=1 Tax=Corynebacterium urinipleomorphum TaxID=1852380 RepID=UPI000B362999|nr:thiaminase II [Corynebacterium urinipleomorphum]